MGTSAAGDIYDSAYIEALFDEMSGSYERMNYITSFGFSSRWRNQLVKSVPMKEGHVVADLMTGMGECWPPIMKAIGNTGKLLALDLSEGMLRFARERMAKYPQANVTLLKENLFANSIPDASVDVVISGFGMKTFSEAQFENFGREVVRILKPGGHLSLVDVSVPKPAILRWPYMFYLKRMIPILGWMFLGNPENYRMLGVYSQRFGDARMVVDSFQKAGLQVEFTEYFFGCASGIVGRKLPS